MPLPAVSLTIHLTVKNNRFLRIPSAPLPAPQTLNSGGS